MRRCDVADQLQKLGAPAVHTPYPELGLCQCITRFQPPKIPATLRLRLAARSGTGRLLELPKELQMFTRLEQRR
jgi:hypothetical protein